MDETPTPPGGFLPELLGLEWLSVERGTTSARFTVETKHMARNGYLHAASVIGLADSACGFGCMSSLPHGASGFTTIELKSNFLGTARQGEVVACEGKLTHGGRTTQLWDAEVRNVDRDKVIALFRCTQLILYPKP